jgi:hypothetical protein
VLDVSFFSGEGDLDYELTTYLLGGGPDAGALRADPAVLTMHMGETSPATISWSGLTPGSRYFGRVAFGATGATTDLYVTTPGEPPASSDEPAIAVSPDYVRPGRTFTVAGVGLPSRTDYQIALDGTVATTGITGDDGTAARRLTLPDDAADGAHEVTITAGDLQLTGGLVATRLLVHDVFENVEYLADGGASVSAEVMFGGEGVVHTTCTAIRCSRWTRREPPQCDSRPATMWFGRGLRARKARCSRGSGCSPWRRRRRALSRSPATPTMRTLSTSSTTTPSVLSRRRPSGRRRAPARSYSARCGSTSRW